MKTMKTYIIETSVIDIYNREKEELGQYIDFH